MTARNFTNPELIWRDISLFFIVNNINEEPKNRESHLHDHMEWFNINDLLKPIIPVVEVGIQHYLEGKFYGEFNAL